MVRGGALGIRQGRATLFATLRLCLWGRGQRGNSDAWSTLTSLFVTSLTFPTSSLCPLGADLQVGRFLHVLGPCDSLQCSLLWGWEVLLLPQKIPTDLFHSLWFWVFSFLRWNPEFCGQSVSLPCFSQACLRVNVGLLVWSSSRHLAASSPPCCLSPHLLLSGWMFLQLLACWTSMQMFLAVLVVLCF